jgi:crotonobetainyl-CoA:carnitine CoA-transferase CaiB-like acyl-CoA transferase
MEPSGRWVRKPGYIQKSINVVKALNTAQVACSAVMSSKDMAADPQYQAREMHIEWEDGQAGKVKGVGIVPKYSRTPGKIWRGAVGLGFDNQRVYSELLGISAEELKELSQQDALWKNAESAHRPLPTGKILRSKHKL